MKEFDATVSIRESHPDFFFKDFFLTRLIYSYSEKFHKQELKMNYYQLRK